VTDCLNVVTMIQQFLCVRFLEEQNEFGVESCRGSDLQDNPELFGDYITKLTPASKVGLSVLSILREGNEKRATDIRTAKRFKLRRAEDQTAENVNLQAIDAEEFCNDAFNNSDRTLRHEYAQYLQNTRDKQMRQQRVPNNNDDVEAQTDKYILGVMDYPWILKKESKGQLLSLDCLMQQRTEQRSAILQHLMGGSQETPFFILKCRRDNVVQDVLNACASNDPMNFRKPLRVEFDGEQGIDEGGVQKELFSLLMEQMFGPGFGMFTYNEESKLYYFAKQSFESNIQFEMFGIVIGLAIYNNCLLDLALPSVAYKKLLSKDVKVQATLNDLYEFEQTLAQGFYDLLQFEESDECTVEDTFCRSFCIEYESFGAKIQHELKPGGSSINVTAANRAEFVDLYVNWLVNDSIEKTFPHFKRGFDKCVGNSEAIKAFDAVSLELTIVGSPVLDFEELKKNTVYADGYKPDSPMMLWLWEILQDEFDESDRKKFLAFTTGSDRAPPKGLGAPESKLTISRVSNAEQLPSAHTCFNHLLVPHYKDKETLKSKLLNSIENCKGFGMM